MRVLIYSDVHANWEALDAMAAATAGRYDASLCLGDVVGYGASPNQTSAWVRDHSPVVIRGNHDRACASLDGIQWFNPAAAAAARWTHATISPEATAWLQALPAGPLAWRELSLVHGSPLDEDEYLIEPAQAAGAFAATSAAQHWFGHTHLQGGFTLADDQVSAWTTVPPDLPPSQQASSVALPLRPDARYLFNPGSVGQPRDGDWRAAFAILDEGAARVEFHRIPYDLAAAQARILEAGLPARLAERLAKGK
ncbi:MAG TPA: metallophosphoesterase family protein [Terriglobales bacterium]|nr:metallophosphoesterase family protein [Terriglobales bacterium]